MAKPRKYPKLVFRGAGGRGISGYSPRINTILARHPDVQAAVKAHTEAIATKARATLDASKQRTGESKIETHYGTADGYIALYDKDAPIIEAEKGVLRGSMK